MKKILTAIFIFSMSVTIFSQELTVQVKNNNSFCFDLYKYINADNENLFLSPFSVSTALAMTYEGARGNTREEMSEILHFDTDNEKFNDSFKSIISRTQTSKDSKHYTFNIANSIWAQQKYDFLQKYFETIEEYYGAPINMVNFIDDKKREAVRLKINDWVAKRTNNKIKDLLSSGTLDKDTKMVLVNAVYFLASWDKVFKDSRTESGDFYTFSGKTEKEFMKNMQRINYAKHNNIQMVEIPYKDNKASMIILLPDSVSQFKEIYGKINYQFFEKIYNKAVQSNVNLYIPKFRIEYKNDLAKILYDAGMKKAFSSKADFSGMVCEEKINIDKIIHQTFIDVNESGTEAAAATAVVMKRVTAISADSEIEFKADRPFIFLIKENTTNSILFIGHLLK